MCLRAAVEVTVCFQYYTRPFFNNEYAFLSLKSKIVLKIGIMLTNFVKNDVFVIMKEIFESHAGRTKTSGGPHAARGPRV